MPLNAQALHDATFAELLAATERTAVHLEMRDSYAVGDEADDFAAFVTDHIRYEHAVTPLNLQAGEQVRLRQGRPRAHHRRGRGRAVPHRVREGVGARHPARQVSDHP